MIPTYVNGFYLATDTRIGSWSVNTQTPSLEQQTNANIIRSFFLNKGWSINAICGMLGCMQGESTINPAFIQQTNRWRLPNSASDISDVPNSVMKNFYKQYYGVDRRAFGIGLVQWDGYSNIGNNIRQQKMVAYAIANNIVWYDGWTQCYRINSEQQYDYTHNENIFFNTVRISGTYYNFDNYPYSTDTPEHLASAWTYGYERNSGGPGYRTDNARWWYDYFTGIDAPDIIPPEEFLLPLEADPDLPDFDPSHPIDPALPDDYFPPWLLFILTPKRKELRRWLVI